MRAVLVWAPTSGSIGMSVSIFSYRGEVTIGLMVDAALVPDPESIIDQLERELDVLAKLQQSNPTAPAAPVAGPAPNEAADQGAHECVNG